MQLDPQNLPQRDTMDRRADYLRSIARRIAACVSFLLNRTGELLEFFSVHKKKMHVKFGFLNFAFLDIFEKLKC